LHPESRNADRQLTSINARVSGLCQEICGDMEAGILTDQNQPIITSEARARLARFLGILSRHRVAVFILVILGIWFFGHLRNPGSGPSSSGSAPSVSSAHHMKLKRFWAYEWKKFESGNPFFTCDYTTLTCRRGFETHLGTALFVTLADDRRTEISHLWCVRAGAAQPLCFSFDTGEELNTSGKTPPVTQDMPENCVTPTDDCDRWIWRSLKGDYLAQLMQFPRAGPALTDK